MEGCTSEQEIVTEYLKESGCEVRSKLDNGKVIFKAIGSVNFGGCVFRNGNVCILSEHTAPFDKPTTLFWEILQLKFGTAAAKRWVAAAKRSKRDEPKPVKRTFTVTMTEARPAPKMLTVASTAMVRRADPKSLYDAVVEEKIRTRSAEDVWAWIKEPPMWWRDAYTRMRRCEDPDDKMNMKRHLKEHSTPCLTQILGVFPTIGWLDVDAKDNDIDVLELIEPKIKRDDRVLVLFHSISGKSFAVGVGIDAQDADAYSEAMIKAKADFERDYPGLKIDGTCTRSTQIRALAWDENILIKDRARFYRSTEDMIPDDIKNENEKLMSRIDGMQEKAKTAHFNCRPSMLDELDRAVSELQIELIEDAWTGKRCYKLKGEERKDLNSLYLEILNFEKTQNENAHGLNKQIIVDHLIANCVDVRDKVMNEVFTRSWDRKDRWPELKAALKLDEFSLKGFQLWMRQGAGLLANKGEADDLQRNFMIILYSPNQHIGKSTLARMLSCGTNSFTQKGLDMKNKDCIAELYCNWIHEFGELGTTFRKKDLNDLKNYVTNTSVAIRRPYDRDSTILPVRTSIIGTTNDSSLFTDDTGNRRYIVIDCGWTREDWPAINAIDFTQLWLQARNEYLEERMYKDGRFPYLMDAEYQVQNDKKCRKMVVKSRELFILSYYLKGYKAGTINDFIDLMRSPSGSMDIARISMAKLIRRLHEDHISNINDALLSRTLRSIGFKEVSSPLDIYYHIEAKELEYRVKKYLSGDEDNIISAKAILK